MIHRTYCDYRTIRQFECCLCISSFCKWLSCQINTSASRCNPSRSVIEFRCIISVFPGSDTDFPEIIHPCPYKVSDNSWILLCHLPKSICIIAECLASQNQTLRIFLQVMLITFDSIIVSGDIHVGKSPSSLHITSIESRSGFHKSASHKSCKIIEELTSYRFLFFLSFCLLRLLGFFFRLLITVNPKANRA